MAKLKDVALNAGVSIATASRVLNRGKGAELISQDCAQRVREIARELGYHGNYHHRSIRRGRAEMIAFVRESGFVENRKRLSPVSDPYMVGLLTGAEAVAHEKANCVALVGPTDRINALERAIRGIRQRQFDGGIIPVRQLLLDADGQPLEVDDTMNLVVIRPEFGTSLPSVDFNHEAAQKMIVEHLRNLGHRTVLWVGPDQERSTYHQNERESLFVTAAWEAGIRGELCHYEQVKSRNAIQAERVALVGEAFADYLKRNPERQFTAVVCYNDPTAVIVSGILIRQGLRIPEDVSVIGVDNARSGLDMVPLTTIDHRFNEMGRKAGELLYRAIEGGDKAREQLIGHVETVEPELVVRESTGPAKSIEN